MKLGQDVYHGLRPLVLFSANKMCSPFVVRLPLGWVLRGPFPSGSSSGWIKKWYVSNHTVINPVKPGEVRRVLIGTAKSNGTSLKKSLLTGPD